MILVLNNIETKDIDIEVTESATMDENIDILKVLDKIKEKGFVISIDDFGTGYSSLSMLQFHSFLSLLPKSIFMFFP